MATRSIIARKISWLYFVFMLFLSQTSAAQLQGRLFTTPEERTYLDALRADFVKRTMEQGFDITDVGPPPLPATEETAAPAASIEYTLGGILTRSDGSHTIWLNNQSLTESSLPSNMTLVMDGALVVLRITTKTGAFQLKPGQTLNDATGEIQETYQRAPMPEPRTEVPDITNATATDLPVPPAPNSDIDEIPAAPPAPETPAETDTRETP